MALGAILGLGTTILGAIGSNSSANSARRAEQERIDNQYKYDKSVYKFNWKDTKLDYQYRKEEAATARGNQEANLAWQDIHLQVLSDAVPVQAWGLMLFNLFWVLAYDTEYAMVDRDDDLRIGMKTSAITLGRYDVTAIMAFYAVYLCGWYGLLAQKKLGGAWTFALCLAGLQAVWHFLLIMDRSREGCFKAFRLNHWLGATVFAGLAVGYAFR